MSAKRDPKAAMEAGLTGQGVDVQAAEQAEAPYMVVNGSICQKQKPREGRDYWKPLCNFDAHIDTRQVRDDGVERTVQFVISGELCDGPPLPSIRIPARSFGSMGWVTDNWPVRAVVEAGQAVKDHLRAAIQKLSKASEQVVHTCSGWFEIDGKWVYLHPGGAIGASGEVPGFDVEPAAAKLNAYRLPGPLEGESLRSAVHKSLEFLDMAPDRISIPLWLTVWRSLLGPCAMTVFLVGRTGTWKTTLCRSLMGHLGEGYDDGSMFAWNSTLNSLRAAAFYAKDSLLLIDDYKPENVKSAATVMAFVQAQGDLAGRDRSDTDGGLRSSKYTRCTALATGEDTPPGGESTLGRAMILEVEAGDISARADAMQSPEVRRRLSGVTSAFLRHVAGSYPAWRDNLRNRMVAHRAGVTERLGQYASRVHPRAPEQLAELLVGLDAFVGFALEAGALTRSECDDLEVRCKLGGLEAVKAQAPFRESSDPVGRVLALTAAAFTSGRAHLRLATSGDDAGDAWGWRSEERGDRTARVPRGAHVGWLDGETAYLDKESWIACIKLFARDQGDPVTWTPATILKRMNSAGRLGACDRDRHDVKKMVGVGDSGERTRKRVIPIPVIFLSEGGASGAHGAEPDVSDSTAFADAPLLRPALADSDEELRRGTGAGRSPGEPGECIGAPTAPVAPVPSAYENSNVPGDRSRGDEADDEGVRL